MQFLPLMADYQAFGSLAGCTGKKEYTPPPWHPSSLGLSPDPEVPERKKTYGVYNVLGKTTEKGIYTRSRKKGVHHRFLVCRKGKRRVSRVVGYISAFAKRGACKRGLRNLGHRTYQLHSNYIPETWSNHDCH